MRTASWTFLFCALSIPLTAQAEDDEFEFGDDDDWDSEEGDGLDLDSEFDEENLDMEQQEGQDTPEIYKAFQAKLERLGPTEEAIEWQKYLVKYPNSLYRARIEKRVEELEANLYDDSVSERFVEKKDAEKSEIYFAQPLFLENIDPRHKLHVGFEMGLPNYLNLLIDYERQIQRNLSAHVGTRQRYTGQNIEAGVRYAFIKSARTQSLLTGIADIHVNTNPGYPAFRPQIAGGKRFNLPNNLKIDGMAQLGTDILFFKGVDPRMVGGFHVAVIPSPTVRFFLESQIYMKDFGWENGAFAFNTVTFGLKFFDRKTDKPDRYEAGVGATVPYYYNYWRQHFGAIAGDFNLYLDE